MKKDYHKKYYIEHKEKLNKNSKKYYAKYKKEIKKKNKKYREEHKEEIKNAKKKCYKINKEKMIESARKNCQKNKDRSDCEILIPKKKRCYKCGKTKSSVNFSKYRGVKDGLDRKCKKCNKKYLQKNKMKMKKGLEKYRKEHKAERSRYRKNKLKYDPCYKIMCNSRRRIQYAVKLQKTLKSKCTKDLIGCSVDFLKKHLESQFLHGMTWDNCGYYGWHIDHIKPCAAFDLTKKEEQKKCFNWKNLQPLWAKDNYAKSSVYKNKLIKAAQKYH